MTQHNLAIITKERNSLKNQQIISELLQDYSIKIFDLEQNHSDLYHLLASSYNKIIFWNIVPPKKEFQQISHQSVVIYLSESCANTDFSYWRKYRKAKFITPYENLYQLFRKFGLDINKSSSEAFKQDVLHHNSKINYCKFTPYKIAEIFSSQARFLYHLYKKLIIKIPLINRLSFPYNYQNSKDYLTSHHQLNNYFLIYPATTIEHTIPKAVDSEKHKIFITKQDRIIPSSVKDAFVIQLQEGSYISRYGSYITKDGILLDDISVEFGSPQNLSGFNHNAFWKKLPPATYYDETVAIIDCAGAYNYNHWTINILPKIDLISKSGIKIDRYIINIDKPFQKQSLEYINFPFEKIIPNHESLNIKARYLVGASIAATSLIHPSSLEFLKQKFISTKILEKKIFITRRNAAQGRKIINEDEIIKLITPYGFEIFELEKLTFKEQISLFSKASVVLSPHGAGLTNILHCPPQAKVIEIYNPNYMQNVYAIMANMLGLDYYYLSGENYQPSKGYYDCSGNIMVNPQKLEKTLQLAELKIEEK